MLGETVERTEYEELKKEMNERFGNVESRLGNVEGRLGNVEGRLQNLENKLENVRVSLDAKIDVVRAELSGRIYGLEREIGHAKWVLYVGFTILGIFSGLTLKYAMENRNYSHQPAEIITSPAYGMADRD